MKEKLHCVLLVDDDENCNYFHKRLLTKMDVVDEIAVASDGKEAIDFLTSHTNNGHPQPAIIFLDINMPVMNGWEFLEHYENLRDDQKAQIVLVLLTTSLNPDDREKALNHQYIDDFENKYLTEDAVNKLLQLHFPEKM
jgi:CheY-like chemotaxis protein